MTLTMPKIKRMFLADEEHTSKWRRQAREDFDFYQGEGQWTSAERQWLQEHSRVPVVFNRTAVIINTVAGNEIQNREEITYSPVEEGDIRPNEVLNSAAQWFRKVAEAEDVESEAFLDSLICGIGATETVIDYQDDPKGKPAMNPPHPIEMYWDCSARRKGLRDRRRTWRVREMSIDDAADLMEMDANDPMTRYKLHAGWVNKVSEDEPHNQDLADQYIDDDQQPGELLYGKVTLVQLQIKEKVKKYRVANPSSGQVVYLDKEEYRKLNNRLQMMGQEPVKGTLQTKWEYMQYWIGSEILEEPLPLPVDGFTLNFITGYRDRNKGTFFGMVSLMRDPQKWANKWLSQILHILDKTSKGGVMAERGAFEDEEQFKQSWSSIDEVTILEDGGMERVKEKPLAKIPTGLFNLMEFAISSIREASGVNLEMLGQRSAIQAASLEGQRKEAGLTILAPVFDSLKTYRIEHGGVMLQYIQRYLADGRLIKIIGEGNKKFVPLALQQDAEFDITIDQSPTSPHIKKKVWQFVMPMIDKLPPPIIAELLTFSPLPGSVVDKLQGMLRGMSEPDPAEEQMKQNEIAQGQADIGMTKASSFAAQAEAMLKQSQVQNTQFKQQLDAQKQQSDIDNAKFDNIIKLIGAQQNGRQ